MLLKKFIFDGAGTDKFIERVVHTTIGFRYEYTLKDHLGNARISFSDFNGNGVIDETVETMESYETEILQENHYYPFGMNMKGPWAPQLPPRNMYQYNGKEFDGDLGLNWYTYGFRMYDPMIGRFPSIDPIAEEFAWVSPYNYAENEPVGSIDLHGLQRLKISSFGGGGSYKTSASAGWQRRTAIVGVSILHPIASANVGSIKHDGTSISSVSSRIASKVTSNIDHRDAIRHVTWSATINQDYGSITAERITNANEGIGIAQSVSIDKGIPFKGDLELASEVVDILNNEIGRSITQEGGDLSSLEIAEKVLDVFKDQGLYTSKIGKDGKVVIERTKITQEEYDDALNVVKSLDENGFVNEKNNEKK